MKNKSKLISCFVALALLLAFSAFPTLGDKQKYGAGRVENLLPVVPLDQLSSTQDRQVLTGQLVRERGQDPELSRRFRNYDLIKIDPRAAAEQIRSRGRLSLKTSKRDFDLQFVPHDLRSSDYSAQVIGSDGVARKLPRTPVNTFKGTVKGESRAQARVSLTENGFEGAIITEAGQYFLQPARDLSNRAAKDEFIFYSPDDVTKEETSCGVTLAEEIAAQEEIAAAKTQQEAQLNSSVSPLFPMKLVRLATDADGEYVAALGGASQATTQIQNIMNMVDGIYQFEIGVTFEIVFQNTWPDANTDPYTKTKAGRTSPTDPDTGLLGEFRDHWNLNFQHVSRNLAHLWTGKDLDGNTIGVASVGVVCRSPDSSYGLSQRFPTTAGNPITTNTVVLTAHEIGHNFSAGHTNQVTTELPSDIENACDNSIMEASVGEGAAFCPFSRSQVVGHANAFSSCLSNAGTSPPSFPSCVETPIDGTGLTANGSLSSGDCRSTARGVGYFADQFSFNGVAGQRVSLTMVHSTPGLDPYLYLYGPDGFLVAQDDDSLGNQDSRIPGTGFGTMALPLTGKYVLEATSFGSQQTGNYTVTVTQSGCTLSVNPTSQHFSAAGGNGTINVTATGSNCGPGYQFTNRPNTASWLQPQITGGSGSLALDFVVQANSSTAGRRAFLVVAPSDSNFLQGGLTIPITQSGTGPDCSVTPINIGQTVNGSLTTGDCESPIRGLNNAGTGFRADRYTFTASAGQQVAITLTSSSFDAFLSLMGPNQVVLFNDDDSGGSALAPTNSRIPGGTGMLTLGIGGTYTIEVSSFGVGQTGPYALNLTGSTASSSTIQFSEAALNVSEGGTSAVVTVTRSGDTSGTSTVAFTTTDTDNFTVNCANTAGNAFARCDFATTVDTLTFAPGETSKVLAIPIIDDTYAEGDETFGATLSNTGGSATLGSPSTATITITDNETVNGANPIFQSPFFVRQHYLDFLSREPDTAGFNAWLDLLNNCPDVNNTDPNAPSAICDRITVSQSFFGSVEFQLKGYFVYRFYKLAFNRLPLYTEIVVDMRAVTGATQTEVFQKKAAFTNNFVLRPDFAALNGQTNMEYVSTLMGRYGLSSITTPDPAAPDGPNKVTLTTDNLISALTLATLTRAQVLRAIADSDQVFQLEFNPAFVAMQYFGYLRRNPEAAGFNQWLTILNANPTDSRTMVNGFMNSQEYRLRFGPQ